MAISKISGSGIGAINAPVEFTSADNLTQLTLTSTDTDANSGPLLELSRNVTGANNDFLGQVIFKGKDTAGNVHTFGRVSTQIKTATSGSETSRMVLTTNVGGSEVSRIDILPTETVINDDSGNLDFRVESSSLANMFHVDGGEDKIFIGHGATHSYDAYGVEVMMQLEAVGTAPYAGFGMNQNSNDADSSVLIFGKSRGTALASTTIVQDGDVLGRIEFQGMDGSDLETGCSIKGMVDGTPGANDMPGRLDFLTTPDGGHSALQRMRLHASGSLSVGSTVDSATLTVSSGGRACVMHSGATGNTQDILNIVGNGNATNNAIRFFHGTNVSLSGGSVVGTIAINTNSTTYNTSSDYRLKENVDYDWDATTRLKQLKPARFNFITDDTNTLVDGFLAHEAQAVVPECATGTHNEVDDDGAAIMQGIDQSKLVPLLVKTIQELEARIKTLEDA